MSCIFGDGEVQTGRTESCQIAVLYNITHELLTPLTIISATVDELKMRFPGHDDLYTVMGSNISRLIRLLQQILEFRKAETGNLKLRVSPGDVAAFVKNEAESFLPLVKKRKIHFSVLCNPESIIGYLIRTSWTRFSTTCFPMPPNIIRRVAIYKSR